VAQHIKEYKGKKLRQVRALGPKQSVFAITHFPTPSVLGVIIVLKPKAILSFDLHNFWL
jgi:hypothetical protein